MYVNISERVIVYKVVTSIPTEVEVMHMDKKHFSFHELLEFGMFLIALLQLILQLAQ